MWRQVLTLTIFQRITSSKINPRIKWNRTSICLVHPWCAGFLEIAMVDWLSRHITVGLLCFSSQSSSILLNHTPWHAAVVAATYSTSIVESAVISCFFEPQDTAAVPYLNTIPMVLFLSSKDPPQLISEYPSNLHSALWVHHNPNSTVPARYLSIRLPAPRCCFVGLLMNLDSIPTVNEMSGRVQIKYSSLPTRLL